MTKERKKFYDINTKGLNYKTFIAEINIVYCNFSAFISDSHVHPRGLYYKTFTAVIYGFS